MHAQAKINPAVILHEAHTTHIWSSKDKALIKRQHERRRKRESFPKKICTMRLLTSDQQANSDRKTNKHKDQCMLRWWMCVSVYNVPLCHNVPLWFDGQSNLRLCIAENSLIHKLHTDERACNSESNHEQYSVFLCYPESSSALTFTPKLIHTKNYNNKYIYISIHTNAK